MLRFQDILPVPVPFRKSHTRTYLRWNKPAEQLAGGFLMKFNIEMLWLPDEMFSQQGRHFRIVVGEPIPVAELQRCGSLREQAEEVRKKAYFLEKTLGKSAK